MATKAEEFVERLDLYDALAAALLRVEGNHKT
jgi:hypothetical protein